MFEFDAVYGAGVPQAKVFEFTGKQIVEDVFQGYNGTIFAYAQREGCPWETFGA